MMYETVNRHDVRDELRRCTVHDRPTVFAIVGREVHTACAASGCQQDAEHAHRMENGAGFVSTVRATIVDTVDA